MAGIWDTDLVLGNIFHECHYNLDGSNLIKLWDTDEILGYMPLHPGWLPAGKVV